MNRRDFTRGLLSLGLTPTLPMPAIGAGSAAPVAVAATADKMYFMGWYTARLNKTCSPEVLTRELKIDRKIAGEICDRLVKSGTISRPDALGVSRTIEPLKDTMRRANRHATRRILSENAKKLDLKTHRDESEETDITEPQEEPIELDQIAEETPEASTLEHDEEE